jgi:hypothetical protein
MSWFLYFAKSNRTSTSPSITGISAESLVSVAAALPADLPQLCRPKTQILSCLQSQLRPHMPMA